MLTCWNSLTPQVQAALIGGLFALVTALGGVGLVIWQLRRQGANAIAANKFNESVKLKKEVYDNIIAAATGARGKLSAAQIALHSAVIEIRVWMLVGDKVSATRAPAMKRSTLTDSLDEARSSFDEVIRVLGAWTIIDPRLAVFSTMGEYVLRDYLTKWHDYTSLAIVLLPDHEEPKPRAVATQTDLDVLLDRSQKLELVFAGLIHLVEDVERELQGLLLSDIFPHRLPVPHRPRRTDVPVVELKHFAELERKYGRLEKASS